MAKPAGRNVSLAELRFKPANSNDAARAALSHHFVNVPDCSFAKDDGISPYLSAQTGMDTFPAAPDQLQKANDTDVPAILGEPPATANMFAAKLRRGGFALSVFLHAIAAAAFGYLALPLPDEAQLEEGTISITFVTEGTSDADARAAGAEEETEEVVKEPVKEEPIKPIVEKPIEEKPIEQTPVVEKPVEEPEPIPATSETVLKDVPMPVLGADVPEILTAKTETEVKVEAAAKPVPTEVKIEPKQEEKPVEQPKPVVKVEEPKREEPKKEEPKKQEKKPEPKKKEKAPEKRKQKRGNKGDQQVDARRGDVDSTDKGQASTNSRGDVANKEIGNATRSNYKGLVNRKLVRAKGRMQSPAKGKVTVVFTIEASGAISGLRVSQSSGKAAIDAIALKIVRNASPFPPIPAEAGKKSWKMTVPMMFK